MLKGLRTYSGYHSDNDLLANFTKVCRAWRTAGNRRLYANLMIASCEYDRSTWTYLPLLCRSLEENAALRSLVKELYIEDVGDMEENYEKLLQLCSATPRVTLHGTTPHPESFKRILGSINIQDLFLSLSKAHRWGYFFSCETEMLYFILTLPAIKSVYLGPKSMFPTIGETNISEDEETDTSEDEETNTSEDEDADTSEEEDADTNKEEKADTSENEETESRDRSKNTETSLRSYRLPTNTNPPLTCLCIMMDNALSTEGLEMLGTLALPHLREFRVNYAGSDDNDQRILECLAKWPGDMKILDLSRNIVGATVQPSKKQAEFAKALDRLSSLKELGISLTMINLQYIFTRPSLTNIVIHNLLNDLQLDLFTSKLEKMAEGPLLDGKVHAFLPILEGLTLSLWCEKERYCRRRSRLRRLCHQDGRNIKLTMNVLFDETKEWVKLGPD